MARIRRKGISPEPEDGWPLDHLLVGVATLRIIRELFRHDRGPFRVPLRPWDLSLWSGVSPQGAADSLKRLHRLDLVEAFLSRRIGDATAYRFDHTHPLCSPLERLFAVERAMCEPIPRLGSHRR